MFKNLSTSKKLYLSPLLFIIFVIIGITTYQHLMGSAVAKSNMASHAQGGIIHMDNARITAWQLFTEPNRKNLDAVDESFKELEAYVQDIMKHQKNKDALKILNNIIINAEEYVKTTNKYTLKKIEFLKQGIKTNPPSYHYANNKLYEYSDKINEDFNQITKLAFQEKKVAINELNIILGILILISTIIFILLSIIVAKTITSSLSDFKSGLLSFFTFLNKESREVKLLKDKNKDEFGQMAKLVNENINSTQVGIKQDQALIDEALQALKEFEQGDFSQRLNLNVKNESLKSLKNMLNTMAQNVETNITNILKILVEYSNNNFLNDAKESKLKGHLLELVNTTNLLGKTNTNNLIERKESGLRLEDGSHNLLKYVNNLNNSSNETAASLEETAAALEQITGNTRNNTANIDKMVDLSSNVTNSVKNGEKLASDTSKAMEDINTQVNAINEAISVIDQIAFQTNILSLNAAVEAATAGEAGKGFAVVAGEVRNLASRSAEAAKEIKDMVENATRKADEGKTMSTNMTNGYIKLNESVSETINIISDIKMASKEQLLGIEQINDAVNQLDRQTQQNAQTASQTNDVSLLVTKVASNIIESVNSNLFKGSDDINIEKITKNTQDTKIEQINIDPKKKSIEASAKIKNDNIIKTKEENTNSEDEWENF